MKKREMILGADYRASLDCHETQLNNNILIVGASGSGKTSSLVEPNIRDTSDSMIISDPKGTLYDKFSEQLKNRGYVVKKLDFTDPEKSDHYNFIEYVRSSTDVVKIAHMLMYNYGGNRHTDAFWDEAGQLLVQSLIAYVVELGKKDYMCFERLMDLIELMEISENYSDCASPLDHLIEAHGEQDGESFAVACYKKLRMASGKTLRSIIITVCAHLGLYDSPELNELMRYDDMDIASIGQRKTAVFVIVSDTDRSLDGLANIFFSQAMNELCLVADKKCKDKRLPIPVRFIMDDFATNCIIYDIPRMISTIRQREISLMLMIQAEPQLYEYYGKTGAQTIIANCDTYVYMGGNDIETAEMIAKRCDVPLRNILEMPIGKSWIFRRGQKPMYVTNYMIKSDEKTG